MALFTHDGPKTIEGPPNSRDIDLLENKRQWSQTIYSETLSALIQPFGDLKHPSF